MAEKEKLKVQKRSARGKWAARRLRAQGLVPGIVYGHGKAEVPIQFQARELLGLLRHGIRLVELGGGKRSETVFIRDLQWDPFGTEILHVDFERVSADERIRVEVQLELRGTAPGIEQGGALSQNLHRVEVECLASEIPEEITVNLRNLGVGQAVHVRDLEVPEGIDILTDSDLVVVQVTERIEEAEPAAEEAEAQPAEPEIVGRRVAGESDEEE